MHSKCIDCQASSRIWLPPLSHSWNILLHVYLEDACSSLMFFLKDCKSCQICLYITIILLHIHIHIFIYIIFTFFGLITLYCDDCAEYISRAACLLLFEDVWKKHGSSFLHKWINKCLFIHEKRKEGTNTSPKPPSTASQVYFLP